MKKSLSLQRPEVSAPYVLGIEGGGTRTTWVLIDESHREVVVRKGEVGPGNILLLSDRALSELIRSIHDKIATLPVKAIGSTFAGVQRGPEKARVRRVLEKFWPDAKQIEVVEDTRSALAAAHGNGEGICIIAGTGSNVIARKNGRIQKAGGWGHLFSDHGSAYDIARSGLEAVYEHYDRTGEVAALGQIFLRVTAQNSLEELVGWMMAHTGKTEVAALAPCVFDTARKGDKLAVAVLRQGAESLARRVLYLARRLKWNNPPIGLFGGLFTKSTEYAALVKRLIRKELPGSAVLVVRAEGAVAATALVGAHGKDEGVATVVRVEKSPAGPTPESVARASTEQRNPRSRGLQKRSVSGLVDLFIAEEKFVQKALENQRKPITRAATLISNALLKGGRLFYVGAGTSGRLGVVDASEMPPTFNAPPEQIQAIMAGGQSAVFKSQEGAEDDSAAGARAVIERGGREGDIVCGIAASGQTPFVHGALREAKKLGIRTVLITCNPNRPKYSHIDAIIDLPTGPEIVTGSTRLKAGTATKLVLNMLSTISMIRLGRVYDNLMIDVQATNAKLKLRARRLVMILCGVNEQEADHLLRAYNWSVREIVSRSRSGG